jgi:CRISPR-associated protein Csm4
MKAYQITLNLQSAFATPLKGDTLFGQLCWAIRNRLGEQHLNNCLEAYTANQPFAVISDAFPEGYLPLPKLPGNYYLEIPGADRKAIKKRCWLPETSVEKPIAEWLEHAKTAADITGKYGSLSEKHPQPHNTINRQTNTTGEAGLGFTPYSVEQEWFIPDIPWVIYLLLDTQRLSVDACQQCLTDIGNIGFGRDASIGLGKFAVLAFQDITLPAQANANSCLTLAPCAPQGLGFDSRYSFYQLFTRFGRHGDIAVHQAGKPFKNPVLLAQTAGVFKTLPPVTGFIGQGIGGNGELSKTLLATVHQGNCR